MKLRRVVGALALLLGFAACSAVPSYEGGPTLEQPYGIVQGEDEVKVWAVDGKPTFDHVGEIYLPPGAHVVKFRVDYPMGDESQRPFEYVEQTIGVEEGRRYRVFVHGEYEKGPPYSLDQKVFKIRGYGH